MEEALCVASVRRAIAGNGSPQSVRAGPWRRQQEVRFITLARTAAEGTSGRDQALAAFRSLLQIRRAGGVAPAVTRGGSRVIAPLVMYVRTCARHVARVRAWQNRVIAESS